MRSELTPTTPTPPPPPPPYHPSFHTPSPPTSPPPHPPEYQPYPPPSITEPSSFAKRHCVFSSRSSNCHFGSRTHPLFELLPTKTTCAFFSLPLFIFSLITSPQRHFSLSSLCLPHVLFACPRFSAVKPQRQRNHEGSGCLASPLAISTCASNPGHTHTHTLSVEFFNPVACQ